MGETKKESKTRKLLSYVLFILKTLGFFVVLNIMAVFYSLRYVITGEKLWGRLAIPVLCGGMTALAFFAPKLFFVLFAIFLFAEMCMAAYIASGRAETSRKQQENSGQNTDNNAEDSRSERIGSDSNRSDRLDEFIFDGLSFEDAKKLFRHLMKENHPDNKGGDAEKAKIINHAYEKYCAKRA